MGQIKVQHELYPSHRWKRFVGKQSESPRLLQLRDYTVPKSLSKQLRLRCTLEKAWHTVKKNGENPTSSKDTRKAINFFSENLSTNIKRIQDQLRKKTFEFSSEGILQKKGNKKKPRPLVIGSVASRVVQRALLDLLQKQKAVKKYLEIPTSFGAIKSKNVSGAIGALVKAIKGGAKYYIKSDIKSFFTRVPFFEIMKQVKSFVDDQDFLSWLEKATLLEINNLQELSEQYRDDFDFREKGIPQGSSLSPLYANMFLYDFDIKLNELDGITCLRFLDDFLIVGPTESEVDRAFKKAEKLLGAYDLSIYTLNDQLICPEFSGHTFSRLTGQLFI